MEQESKPSVSVIVPVYNGEKELGRMLTCLKKQSYTDYEVIIVNDGSTDGTQNVIDEFTGEDNRFRCIKQSNGGVSAARNAGLKEALGEYIAFYDADDEVPKDGLKWMMGEAEKEDADLVIGLIEYIYLDEVSRPASQKRLSKMKRISRFDADIVWCFSLTNKIFRRKVIEEGGLRFEDINHMEDGLFLYSFLGMDPEITGCPHLAYRCIKRPFWQGVSLSQSGDEHALDETKSSFERIVALAEKSYEEEKSKFQAQGRSEIENNQLQWRYLRLHSELFRRFARSALIYEFYSKIWMEPGNYDKICKKFEECTENIFPVHVEAEKSKFPDIRFKDGRLYNIHELCESPILSVCICRAMSREALNLFVAGLYYQRFVAFELLIENSMKELLDERFENMPNIHFYEGKEGAVPIDKVRSEYVWPVEECVIPPLNILRQMTNKVKDKLAVQAPVKRYDEKKGRAVEIKKEVTEESTGKGLFFKKKKADKPVKEISYESNCIFNKDKLYAIMNEAMTLEDIAKFKENSEDVIVLENNAFVKADR